MGTPSYNFLRALEYENRHPEDAGVWGITFQRLAVGEGTAPEESNCNVEHLEGTPLPPAPRIPASQLRRIDYYKRIRTIAECERAIQILKTGPIVSLYLFPNWIAPRGNVISMPSPRERAIPQTHAVHIVDFSNARRQFRFWNNWGDWGDRGNAYLPYEYFEKYVFESWMPFPEMNFESRKEQVGKGRKDVRWVGRDESSRRIYGFEIWDQRGDDRWAWAFVVERDSALEIEELFVRPEFRGKSLGTSLAEKVKGLAVAKCQPIRLWVPFADCKSEHPSNFHPLVRVTKRLGLHFQPSPINWTAYFATNEGSGSDLPIEPEIVPPRPKCPRATILAAAFALGGSFEPNPSETQVNGAIRSKSIEVVDRGRGPQLSTSRITVQDLVPYFQQNCTNEEIMGIMPVLTLADIETVRQYVRDNHDAVMEQDRRIRERNAARTTPPEIEEIRKRGQAKILALKEQFSQKKPQEGNGDRTPG